MAITVKFLASFRVVTGKGEDKVGATGNIASLLDELVGRFGKALAEQLYVPGTRKLREDVNILVNGRGISYLRELNTPLNDGDVVTIFPSVSGGKLAHVELSSAAAKHFLLSFKNVAETSITRKNKFLEYEARF